jgi:S1-C subfamily serine protease
MAGKVGHRLQPPVIEAPPTTFRPEDLARPRWKPWVAVILVAAVAVLAAYFLLPQGKTFTQADLDAAVAQALKTRAAEPSHAAMAYAAIRPSIVLIQRMDDDGAVEPGPAGPKRMTPLAQGNGAARHPSGATVADKPSAPAHPPREHTSGLGTGVVVTGDGLILTSLHVVNGAARIGLVFADGSETDADIVSAQLQNDLAVLKAKNPPPDLVPATLRASDNLKVGDEIATVGFPYGVGPSLSSGIVSGLRRGLRAVDTAAQPVDLIQFDAAANPGNSGGPLVTSDGQVVGIVTSILSPTDKGFFVGIAFAVPVEKAVAAAAGPVPFQVHGAKTPDPQ